MIGLNIIEWRSLISPVVEINQAPEVAYCQEVERMSDHMMISVIFGLLIGQMIGNLIGAVYVYYRNR